LSQWLELGGVGLLYRVDRFNHPRHTPGIHGLQNGFRKSGAGGVDPPLAAATLVRGSPNITTEQAIWDLLGEHG